MNSLSATISACVHYLRHSHCHSYYCCCSCSCFSSNHDNTPSSQLVTQPTSPPSYTKFWPQTLSRSAFHPPFHGTCTRGYFLKMRWLCSVLFAEIQAWAIWHLSFCQIALLRRPSHFSSAQSFRVPFSMEHLAFIFPWPIFPRGPFRGAGWWFQTWPRHPVTVKHHLGRSTKKNYL